MLLVDLMDASGSFLPRVRDLVGKNPVVLVGTKVVHAPLHEEVQPSGFPASQWSAYAYDARIVSSSENEWTDARQGLENGFPPTISCNKRDIAW